MCLLKVFGACHYQNAFQARCFSTFGIIFFVGWVIMNMFFGGKDKWKKKWQFWQIGKNIIIAILGNSFQFVDFQKYKQWFLRYNYTYVCWDFKGWKLLTKNYVQNMPKWKKCGNFLAKTKTWQFWKNGKNTKIVILGNFFQFVDFQKYKQRFLRYNFT